jgi:hypothetical protein
MAKNRYKCNKCDKEIMKYSSITNYPCDCGGDFKRQMPTLSGRVQVNETVDKYRNVKHKQDQKKVINDRKVTHYWTIEVPKMVASGIYELETMLEMNWVYYNEQGKLCTRTSPPEAE